MFRKKSGTTDKGKNYEDYLITLLLLRLSTDTDIKDFALSSNHDQFGAFDDIVFTTHGIESKNYAIQVKHTQNKKDVTLESLATKSTKGDFSIQKYFKSFQKISSSQIVDEFVIYTNRKMAIEDQVRFKLEDKNYEIVANLKNCVNILNTSGHNMSKVKFEIGGFGSNEEEKNEISEYRQFLEKFSVYVNQANVNVMKSFTFAFIKDNFSSSDETIAKTFLEFVQKWSQRERQKIELTKKFVKLKIAEILLVPFMQAVSSKVDNKKATFLKNILDQFDIIVVEKMQDFPSLQTDHPDIDKVNEIGKKFSITSQKVEKIEDMKENERSRIFWHLHVEPLIVKVSSHNFETVRKAVLLSQNVRKFILMGENIDTRKISGMTVFRRLSDCRYDDSYNILLEKCSVSLQGRKPILLKTFLEINGGLRNIVTFTEITKMLNDNFFVGNRNQKLPSPYITRHLFKNLIKFDFINTDDLSVISCKGKLEKIKQHLENVVLINIEEYLNAETKTTSKIKQKVVYYHKRKCAKQEFEKFCSKNSQKICHHFKVTKRTNLEWLTSNGNIRGLRHFYQEGVSECFQESEIFNLCQNNFNIICGDSGMGKTVMMAYFEKHYPSNSWIVNLNFREAVSVFNESENEDILDFICKLETEKNVYSSFEQNVMHVFRNNKKITILWDGFDELPSEFIDKALNVMKKLARRGIAQWVTVRTHSKTILEDEFNVLSFTIRQFSESEQKFYIKNRLCGKNEDELSEATSKIFTNIAATQKRGFLGVPLHLYILTDLLGKNSDKYLRLLDDMFTLTDMYHHFFEEQLSFNFGKTNCDFLNAMVQKIFKHNKLYHLQQYETLALKINFNETFQKFCDRFEHEQFLEEVKNGGDYLGITYKNASGEITFHHKSFAEYFVALWLSKHCKYLETSQLEKFLFDGKRSNIRLMFDMIVAKDRLAHLAVLYKNVDLVKKYKDCIAMKDDCGRTPLHLVCSWGEKHNLSKEEVFPDKHYIYGNNLNLRKNCDQDYDEIIDFLKEEQCDIFERDDLFSWNAIDYACHSLSLRAINRILSVFPGVSLKDVPTFESVCSVLWYSVMCDYKKLFPLLEGAPYFEEKHTKMNLLHLSVIFGRTNFFHLLVEIKKYCRVINQKCIRPSGVHLHIPKINIKHWSVPSFDINLANIHTTEETALHIAVVAEDEEIIKTLLGKKAKVGEKTSEGQTPLHYAATTSRTEISQFLVTKGAKVDSADIYNRTPLHYATFHNKPETVKFLFEKSNILYEDYENWTPLGIAADLGFLEIFKYLEPKCDIVDVNSTLLIAAESGQIDIIQYLLNETKVDVNFQKNGKTALHFACRNGHFDVVQFLITKKAKLTQDDSKCSELHYATTGGFLKMIKFLVKNKADVNVRDEEGRTPLHHAVTVEAFDVVQFLCKNGADVHVVDKNGNTALSLAEKTENEKICEFLKHL